jgi:hypothetical protein
MDIERGIIRVFPRRNDWTPNDDLAFVGDPPLFLPPEMPVMVSVVFTWDIPEGVRLFHAWKQYYPNVQLGGPAFGDPGKEFVPGRFIKNGVTFTSRGCRRKCPYCFAWKREGGIRELPVLPGHIIQDNNLFACSDRHIESVFEMLSKQKRAAVFSGGIDARVIEPHHVSLLESIRIKELWFACDSRADIPSLERSAGLLSGIPTNKKRCYVLLGYSGDSIEEEARRAEKVLSLGFLPFAQLYQGERRKEYGQEWKDLARYWSRPAAYRSKKAFEPPV